jgi:hypothetical protein
MSSFFRNVDTRHGVPRDIPLVQGHGAHNPIRTLKARAILIDMEEGVVSQARCDCVPVLRGVSLGGFSFAVCFR